MLTVFKVVNQSLKIKDTLKLEQALYAKATKIKWKHSKRFERTVLRMGAFHKTCTFLGIISKKISGARLKDIRIESGVITEGSVSGVLETRSYNRAVRFQNLMYNYFSI